MNERSGYAGIVVATKLLEQALRRIEQLPDSEQPAAAWVLLDYVKHMRDRQLTDVQAAEVQRRWPIPTAGWYLTLMRASASRGWISSRRYELVFDDRALADIENIFSWIAQDSPSNAKAVVDRLFSSAEIANLVSAHGACW